MPAWIKRKSLLIAILSILIVNIGFTRLYAAEITVHRVTTKILNDIYVVNASLSYELGEKTIEALENGIPLTFYIEVEFERPRTLIWNKQLIRHSQKTQLEHHPLSDQYVLTNLVTADQFSFNSLNDALGKLGKISNLPVAEKKYVSSDNMIGKIRTGLDIESLPPPMRLQAWFSSEWRVSSGWYQWDITP